MLRVKSPRRTESQSLRRPTWEKEQGGCSRTKKEPALGTAHWESQKTKDDRRGRLGEPDENPQKSHRRRRQQRRTRRGFEGSIRRERDKGVDTFYFMKMSELTRTRRQGRQERKEKRRRQKSLETVGDVHISSKAFRA